MKKSTARLTQGAMIAAAYAALSFLQNLLLPGSASMTIQFRLAESLMVLAFFTPSAIPGLALGCGIFNLVSAGILPLDALVGAAATAIAAAAMWLLRKRPFVGLFLPVVCNGLIIGWELSLFMGGGFWLNAGYVALGEAAVMLTLGSALHTGLKKHHRIFEKNTR